MATAAAPQTPPPPDADDRFDPTEEFPRPPDEDFWERYSGRLEFPLSWTVAILFHVLVAVGFLVVLPYLMSGKDDRSGVPVRIIEVGGLDDSGAGKAGSGGKDALREGENAFAEFTKEVLPTLELPTPSEQQFQLLDQAASEARKKDKPVGAQRGAGNQAGRGNNGEKGGGPGGAGNDGTHKRAFGWTIRFSFEDTAEYTKQLAAAGAVLLVPLPPDNSTMIFFGDMNNPSVRRVATPEDTNRLKPMMRFYEQEPKKVRQFLDYLKVDGQPNSYFVCFPREFEEDLMRKELAFKNWRPEDIARTVFVFVTRGGKYEVQVFEQQRKK